MNFIRSGHGPRLALALLLSLCAVLTPLLASAPSRQAGPASQGMGRIDALATGRLHSCGLRGDGSAACWGDDSYGQLTAPAGPFTQLSTNGWHTCGVRSSGAATCWGYQGDGRATAPAGNFRQVAAGGWFSCGIRMDGTLACWGYATSGATTPPAGTFVQVSAGQQHACAIRANGTAACWGLNSTGEAAAPAGTFSQVSAGLYYSCGITTGGNAVCWGNSTFSVGENLPPAGSFVHVQAGHYQACGIRADGTGACWGENGSGESTVPAGQFLQVNGGEGFSCGLRNDGTAACWGANTNNQATPPTGTFGHGAISAGVFHSCNLRTDGSIGCWGENLTGQAAPPAGTFVQVQAAYGYSCGLHSDGTLACWGTGINGNAAGQATPPAGSFTQFSAGRFHSCAVRSAGTVGCWGLNDAGQTTPAAGSFVHSSVSDQNSCGLRADGSLACWGSNLYGLNAAPSGTFTQIASGFRHHCALRTDGTVTCWGVNADGQVAAPAGTFRQISAQSTATCGVRSDGSLVCWGSGAQVHPPAGAFVQVSTGHQHACGIRDDGVRLCWGENVVDQAPQPTLQPVTLPVALFGQTYSASLSLVDGGYVGPTPAFVLTAGALPPGLSLSVAGVISGAPTAIGTYTFTIEGEDRNGFVASRTYTLLVDDTAPVIVPSITGTLGDNGWYIGDVEISWSVTDPESGIVSSTGCNTVTLSSDALAAGYTCTATSGGGTTSETVTVKRDATPPDTTLDSTPSDPSNSADATFAFSGSDDTSGIAGFECSLDGATFATCSSPFSATGLADGTHTFDVRAKDAAGSLDASPASHTWVIETDTTPPVIAATVTGTLGDNGWYTSDVAISWSVTDDGSTIASTTGCNATTLSTDALGAGYTCTATSAGGTASETVTVKRDTGVPTIAAGATTSPNAAGWYTAAVDVQFTCDDALSGVSTCAATQTLSAQGSAVSSVAGTATDNAGNASAPSNVVTVSIDTIAPETTLDSAPSDPSDSASATFVFGGSDATSGVAGFECNVDNAGYVACASPLNLSGLAEGAHTFAVRASDVATNVDASPASYTWTIDTDDTAPVIVPTVTGTLGDNGWYTSDVAISWSVSDAESSISSTTGCTAVTLTTDALGASYTCTATSIGGTASETLTIKRDATAPTVSAAATTAANAAGWYNSDVSVGFTCSDALSGVVNCPSSQTLASEGAAVSSTAQTVTDAAGNSSAASNVVTVKLDKTAPTLAPVVLPSPLLLNATMNGSANGSDGLSGIATQGCAALDTTTVGSKSTACGVTDRAGNTATASAAYRVIYGFAGQVGFAPPRGSVVTWNVATVKTTIPFTWTVFDANNAGVTTLAAATITRTDVACPAKVVAMQVPSAPYTTASTLQSLGNGQYRQHWRLPAPGGACARMTLDLGDGELHHAMFKFE